MASHGLGPVTTIGKLSWVDMLYYENEIVRNDSILRQQAQDQAEYQQMMEKFNGP